MSQAVIQFSVSKEDAGKTKTRAGEAKSSADVVKSNALVVAEYMPKSIPQHRLLTMAISKIKSGEKLDGDYKVKITAAEIAEYTGGRPDYRLLKKGTDELGALRIKLPNFLPNGEGKAVTRTIPIAGIIDYCKGGGYVEMNFDKYIIPYLSSITSYFTKYDIKELMDMKSIYGARIYEIAQMAYNSNKKINGMVVMEYDIAEFKNLIGIGGECNQYKRINNITIRILKTAQADIEKNTQLRIEWRWRRSGKKTVGIQIKIKKIDNAAGNDGGLNGKVGGVKNNTHLLNKERGSANAIRIANRYDGDYGLGLSEQHDKLERVKKGTEEEKDIKASIFIMNRRVSIKPSAVA